MKQRMIYFFATSILMLGMGAQAQSTRAYQVAKTNTVDASASFYSLPMTTLKVTVVAEHQMIKTGPYARFAQKYLGIVAPLTDKNLYKIVGGEISYFEEADPSKVYALENADKVIAKLYSPTVEGFKATSVAGKSQLSERFAQNPAQKFQFVDLGIVPIIDTKTVTTVSNIKSDTGMVAVPIDRKQLTERSLEEMAAEAANTIYTLRKRRFDLITGEAGENVFGSGLSAAIEEMKRIENEYISLFLGKKFTQQISREYEILPDSGRTNLVVCRFSETSGLMDESDLSGRPIILELKAQKKTAFMDTPRKGNKDPRGTIFYRIADIVNCKLIDEKTIIVNERVPIYQYGTIVEVPINSIK